MFSSFERFLAFRYLRSRRQERAVSLITTFSFLGITLGVATLIIVMSVMNGFRVELMKSILGFGGHIVVVNAQGEGITDVKRMKKRILDTAGVISVTPMIDAQALVLQKKAATGVMVHGIRPQDLKQRDYIAKNVKHGQLSDFATQEDAILIGAKLAKKLGALPGDYITLVAPEASHTAFGLIPRMRSFQVKALFEVGMSEFDRNVVFIPLKAAQKFFRLPHQVNKFEIFTNNPENAPQIRKGLESKLMGQRPLDWQQIHSSFFSSIQIERNVMFLILALIILVAAFNIISSLVMMVKDKTKNIAIMRAMGATRRNIRNIFFLCGATIGTVGTICGLVLGLYISFHIEGVRQIIQWISGAELFNADVYFINQLPSDVRLMDVLATVVISLSLSFVASLYPALRAAKLMPAEALRYE